MRPAPLAAAESAAPLATKIFLSSTSNVWVFNIVSVPWTVKFPRIVTSSELSVIAVLNDCVNEFNELISVDEEVNPNAVIWADELTIPPSSDVRYEPLSPSKESNLWSADEVNVFKDEISVDEEVNPNAVIWAEPLSSVGLLVISS